MAVTTKKTFNAVGSGGQSSTTVFTPVSIELNNQDDLDVYVTLSGGTRVLQYRQSTGGTTDSNHPQVNDTTGLYFPAQSAGVTLYNYTLSTDNNTITFNSALPTDAVVSVERRTRDSSSDYTNFVGGSTIRHTDVNKAFDESNFTAQEARNKAFELEGKIFGTEATSTSFITSDEIVDGTIVNADVNASAAIAGTKVSPDFGSQAVVTTGTLAAGATTVTGNITVSGTVDGRDVATDGSKLDGIEAGATGNQTNAEIRTAVEAASDSNVFTDADHSKLNAIEAGATADQTASEIKTLFNSDGIVNAQIDASAAIAGTKISPDFGSQNVDTTGNILLDSDSNKLKIGDDEDLEIYHNGSNSYVDNTGTGHLYIRSDNGVHLMSETHPSQNYVVCTDGGSVGLYHNGAKKIETGTNGVIVTGNLDLNGNLDVSGGVTLPNDSISTAHIADTELTTLAGMQSGTASILASSTALTSTTAELNLLDGKSISTTISGSSTDNQLPTAKAVNDAVANISDAGNFVPIANEVSFPNSNPDPGNNAGTIVSIADAGGIVVNGSGVSTTGRTLGGATVTINGIDSSLHSTTIAAGKGMLVQTTTTTNTYDYHRLVVDEAGVAAAQTLVSDFNNRYRIGSSNPSSSLDDGDLFFNTTSNKMLVYNDTDSSWDEVQSVGNYFINTISSYSGTGGNNATFNGTAYRFVLSNAGAKAEQHLVSINGVIQKPNSGTSQPSEGFAIDGSSIIFSNAPATGSDYFIITIGSSVNIGTPSNNTVSTATIQNLAVTGDKIATNLDLADNKKIRFGTGNDLEIYHSGSHSYIRDVGTGSFRINASQTHILNAADTEFIAKFIEDGAVELYYDTSKKFNTTSSGVDIRGTSNWCEGNWQPWANNTWDLGTSTYRWQDLFIANDIDISDNGKLLLGDGDDLQIYHDGSVSKITNSTGNFIIEASASGVIALKPHTNENGIITRANGASELYYDNSKKFETTTTGVKTLGNLSFRGSGDTEKIIFDASSSHLKFLDDVKAKFGTGADLQIYHDGTNSHIKNTTNNLYSWAAGHHFFVDESDSTVNRAVFLDSSGCELYYDGSKKLETTSTGVKITDGGPVLTVDATNNSSGLRINVEAQTTGELLRVQNDGTTKFQITHDGKAAFGTTNTTATAGTGFKINANSAVIPWVSNVIDTTSSGHSTYHLYNLHSSYQGYRFYVTANGGISNYSSNDANLCDEREKKSITDAPSQLATVKAWKLRNFRYNFQQDSEPLKVGVIAQEIETVNPELVSEEFKVRVDDDGNDVLRKGVKEEQMMMISIKALQELITKVETLETKVAALEAK